MSASAPNPERFFVALLPPAAIQTQVTAIKQEIYQRFHSQAALKSPPHITLQPPFTWPTADLGQLYECLATFAQGQPAIPLRLSDYNAFPPRVIYIDVVPEPLLTACQAALQQAFADALGIGGSQAPRHPFTPHMTVGFRDLEPAAFHQAWEEFQHRPYQAAFVADEITLLRHDGQRWQVASAFRLAEPE